MKIAHIVPPDYLLMLRGTESGYHFALGQELLRDATYREFYRALSGRGHFIIVDNGAAELHSGDVAEIPPFKDIVAVANYIGADEIILPDKLRDKEATLKMYTKAVADNLVEPRRRMIVPQGETLEEWFECLRAMRYSGFSTIGVPKHMERLLGGRATLLGNLFARLRLDNVHVHLLGAGYDPIDEVKYYTRNFPQVRGIDTGAAIAWAQNGVAITDPIKQRYSLDWDRPCSINLATRNMETLNAAGSYRAPTDFVLNAETPLR